MHREPKKLESMLAALAMVFIFATILAFLNDIALSLFNLNINFRLYENFFAFLNKLKDVLFSMVIVLFILFVVAKLSDGHITIK